MRPDRNVEKLDISCDDRCHCGACDAECGRAEFAENQDVVADEVYADGDGGRDHRRYGLAVGPDRSGVCLSDCKWQKADAHDFQIQQCSLHRLDGGAAPAVFMEIEADEEFTARHKDHETGCDEQGREDEFKAECPARAFVVPFAAILGGENPDAGESSEYAQIPYEKE